MADNIFGSLAPEDWQAGVEKANKYGQLSPSSPPDQTAALLMAAMARAGMTLQKNAPLLAETAPGRMIQGISRVATGGTPYAGPGLRREDYTDDPEARHPVEPMIHDAMNLADVMSMGGMPMAAHGAIGSAGGKLVQPTFPKLSMAEKRAINERAFEAARFENKLASVDGRSQQTEFVPPHPDAWARR